MGAVTTQLEDHRGELTGYCYRMLGSGADAEDAVQEVMVRAWKNAAGFEGRSSVRTWLYRIATNVCLDMLRSAQRRVRPMDLGPSASADVLPSDPLPDSTWLGPMPDAHLDPQQATESKESVRLAFIAALQHLPAKQRAVLVLREVLDWPAADVAQLLDTSVASVNSAMQRARATLSKANLSISDAHDPQDSAQRDLLARYVDAFEQYDMDTLTSLLAEDAFMTMPPLALWLRGSDQIREWMLGIGNGCEGSRLLPTVANGAPAFAQYRPNPLGGWNPWSLQVIDIIDGRITGLNMFLNTEVVFPMFGMPPRLEPAA